jgi:hypothetical protein
MLRTALYAVAAGTMFVGLVIADSTKHAKARNDSGLHAMFVKADAAKNTVTFTTTDKVGKRAEMTLPLAKDAKILGEDNKPETLATFAKNMEKEKDKSILVIEDQAGKQIVEVRDLPNRVAGR